MVYNTHFMRIQASERIIMSLCASSVSRHLVATAVSSVVFTIAIILLPVEQAHSTAGIVSNSYNICLSTDSRHCEGCQESHTDVSNVSQFVLRNNTLLKFCSEEFRLESVLSIENSNYSVTLIGFPTKLTCRHGKAGIHIHGVTGLTLQEISLISCGSIFNDSHLQDYGEIVNFMSSIFIVKCQHVKIENVAVSGGQGNGLTLFDNGGTVKIYNCSFKDKPCGSGIHIVLSYCHPRNLTSKHNCGRSGMQITQSMYNITGCNFKNNSAYSKYNSSQNEFLAEGFNRGGGLSVVIDTNSNKNTVLVADSNFTDNSASWGGGLFIEIIANSSNNTVNISNCHFHNNSSPQLGGGGAVIGYQHYQDLYPQDNSIIFENCSFECNKALFGGGVSAYASPSQNKMIFRHCNWTRNVALLGSAVDISPQVWESYVQNSKTTLIFSDCNFRSNYPTHNKHSNFSYLGGSGAFLAVGYLIVFKKSVHFDSNNGSAMYLNSADVEFFSNSNVTFTSNRGFSGGAIFMKGFSTLIMNDNITVSFYDNSADISGGAIHKKHSDQREFGASWSCFVRYNGTNVISKRGINLLFVNNTAGEGCRQDNSTITYYAHGQSIFASTLEPCLKSFKSKECLTDPLNIFDCIGNSNFTGDCNDSISTSGRNITMDTKNENMYSVVPGKIEELPITTLDDLSKEVLITYKVSVYNVNGSNIKVDSAYTLIRNKSIRFYGCPGNMASVTLETTTGRKLVYEFMVSIQECPPGFIYLRNRCVCSAKKRFDIQSCDEENFEAKLLAGYWMGYNSNGSDFGIAAQLMYSICPLGYCLSNKSNATLPQNTSVDALEDIICGRSRKGILCSRCRENYSANYHDSDYSCKEGDCTMGWLYYILSEIFPVTAFFIVVMVFNIKFTDGAINGFILFAQISDTMVITGNEFIHFPPHSKNGFLAYRFLTGIFNLKFFELDSLSFCLWKGASTLDLLAFKYITILYASTLVVVIIVIMKYCQNKRISNIMKLGSAASVKSTIIHGISGFLVICYSECVRISLLLITQTQLFTGEDKVKKTVALYNGELDFFRSSHLLYALPALFIVLTLGLLPPLILMSYPLCYKVFSFLKISETKFTKLLCTCLPLEKFKPFFDSFQSSFKDEYRVFSGLYFLYRLTTLVSFAIVEIKDYYILVQIQLTVIFTVHALCQPYKKRWHNILDALLFANLSLINLITLFNFHITLEVLHEPHIKLASTVQIVLLFLPLVYVALYSTVKIISEVKSWKRVSASSDLDYYRTLNNFPLDAAADRSNDY